MKKNSEVSSVLCQISTFEPFLNQKAPSQTFFRVLNTPLSARFLNCLNINGRREKRTSVKVLKNYILKFRRPSPIKISQCHNPKGTKLVTRLKLGLSDLREHKFKHSFQDTLNPLCSRGLDIETTSHYFLHCPLFHPERSTLRNNIKEIDSTILIKSESVVIGILLCGDKSFKDEVILNVTIDFILSINRFDEPLYLL